MNYIKVLTEDNEILINLDNIVAVVPNETGVAFNTLFGTYETKASLEEVEKIIETMQHRSNRIRIDGLKGETLNVKVVNK